MARPTVYNSEMAKKICTLISTSHKSLRTVAKEVGISVPSILTWLQVHPEFLAQYTHAKEEQADYLTEEMLEISDDSEKDTMTVKQGGSMVQAENKEWVNRSRLRVETRKWIASKLKPKKYGDKLDVNQTIRVEQPLFPDVQTNNSNEQN